jgi:hypothetical protein
MQIYTMCNTKGELSGEPWVDYEVSMCYQLQHMHTVVWMLTRREAVVWRDRECRLSLYLPLNFAVSLKLL